MTDREIDFEYWEKRYGRSLSEAEKNAIVTNLSGFFRVLIKVDLREQKKNLQKEIQVLEDTARVYGVEI